MPPCRSSCRHRRPRVQPDDAIRAADQLGAMGDHEHRPAGAHALDRRGDDRHALGVEVGGRLVEDDERRVAQEGAGEPDPPALAGRERAPAVAEHGVVAGRQRRDERVRAGERRGGPHRVDRRARRAEADVVGDARPQQRGLLRHPGDVPAPRGRVAGREVDAAHGHPPRDGPQEPEQQRGGRALPRPARSDERDELARRRASGRTGRGPGPGRAGYANDTRSSRTGARGRTRRQPPAARARPPARRRSAPASAPRPRARRRTRGTRRRAGAAAGRAPARARGPSGPASSPSEPPTSRTPTVTATSATPERGRELEHGAGEEADAQRAHRGAPVAVADRRASRAPSSSARLNARSVGSPRTTSRKCTDRRRSACQRSRVCCSVARPISHMNTGTSGSVSVISSADWRSIVATHATQRAGRSRRGRAAAGSARSSRRARRRRGPPPPRPRRPRSRRRRSGCAVRRRSTSSSRSSDSTSAAARRPATSMPQPSAPRTANASASSDELGAQRRERRAVGRARRRSARAARRWR